MKNSNRKGKVGEREFAAVLRSAGFDARRCSVSVAVEWPKKSI